MAKKTTLEDVAKLIVKQGKEINDLTEVVGHIVSTMATKGDLSTMATKEDLERLATKEQLTAVQMQVNSIEGQLRQTRIDVRLGDLEEKVFGQARR